MNMPELAAFVALIADDAERRFGDDNVGLREAYAREATFELWMAQPGITVAAANRILRQVRDELGRRWSVRQERNAQRRVAIEALLAELALPAGHCPNSLFANEGFVTTQSATPPHHLQNERTERSGLLATS